MDLGMQLVISLGVQRQRRQPPEAGGLKAPKCSEGKYTYLGVTALCVITSVKSGR